MKLEHPYWKNRRARGHRQERLERIYAMREAREFLSACRTPVPTAAPPRPWWRRFFRAKP